MYRIAVLYGMAELSNIKIHSNLYWINLRKNMYDVSVEIAHAGIENIEPDQFSHDYINRMNKFPEHISS